jgi:hypothetical protein
MEAYETVAVTCIVVSHYQILSTEFNTITFRIIYFVGGFYRFVLTPYKLNDINDSKEI